MLASADIARADEDEAVVELERHLQSGFPAALLKSWPLQRVHDGVDARCLTVSMCDPSDRSALDFLNGADLIFSVGIPDCGCILKYRSNKDFVRSFLCLLVADLEVAPEEAKCPPGFAGGGISVSAPFHVSLNVDNQASCGADVFKGKSTYLI